MAINFPNSPSVNDIHSEGGIRWKWNGSSWTRASGAAVTDTITTANDNSTTTLYPVMTSGTGGQTAKIATTATKNISFDASDGNLTVGGNVSVGGTLTYEDVKNVDSVGIITAREGIRINADSKTLLIGASGDLRLQHDGSNSFVDDAGTGALRVRGSEVLIQKVASTENMFRGVADAQSELYYNAVKKFETMDSGVQVSGITSTTNLNVTGVSTFTGYINLAQKIIHTGDADTSIEFDTNTIKFETAGSERLRITSGGSVNIGGDYTQTSKKFKVTGNTTIDGGLLVTGLLEGGSGFSVSSGNLTLPAYTYHDGDSDTYYGFSSANQFSVFTAGSQRLKIDGNGVVQVTRRLELTNSGDNHYVHQGRSWAWTSNGTSTGTPRGYLYGDSSGNLRIGGGSDWGEDVRIASGGNIQVNGGAVHLDANGELAVFETDTNLAFTNSSKLCFDFSSNVARIRSSVNGSATIRDIGIYTGNSERVRITSGGDVGIGYNSPTVKLHVREAASGFSGTYDNRYHILMENSGEAYLGFYVPDNSYAGIRFHDTTGVEGYIDYYFNTDEMVYYSTGIHRWSTAGTERLRIDSSGRLLIGTTTEGNSVADDLTIAGSGDSGITIRSGTSNEGSLMFSDATSGSGEYSGWVCYNHNSNFMRFFTNAAERLRITSGGDVGVGNNSPNCRLAVKDIAEHTAYASVTPNVTDVMLQLYNNPPNETTNDHSTIQFGVNGGAHNRVNSISAVAESAGNRKMAFTFCTDEAGSRTEKMRISGDGKISVGTVQTTHTLGVTGGSSSQLLVKGGEADIWLTSTGSGSDKSWRILGSTGGSTHRFRIYDSANTREPFYIDNDGVSHFGGDVKVLTGDIQMGNGRGMNFSATADGPSMGSETLDDYEEGSWSPSISNLGNHSTSSDTYGGYTKVGDQVTVRFKYKWTGRSTTNGAYSVTLSLPFTAANVDQPGHGTCGVEGCQPHSSDRTSYHTTVSANATTMLFRCSGANNSENSFNGSISTSMSSGYFMGVVTYKSA